MAESKSPPANPNTRDPKSDGNPEHQAFGKEAGISKATEDQRRDAQNRPQDNANVGAPKASPATVPEKKDGESDEDFKKRQDAFQAKQRDEAGPRIIGQENVGETVAGEHKSYEEHGRNFDATDDGSTRR